MAKETLTERETAEDTKDQIHSARGRGWVTWLTPVVAVGQLVGPTVQKFYAERQDLRVFIVFSNLKI